MTERPRKVEINLAAIPVAVLAGACLLGSSVVPVLLVLVPFLAALRLTLNLLDGAVARRSGRMHPRGELYNEVGDRICDIAFLAPVAFLQSPSRWLRAISPATRG